MSITLPDFIYEWAKDEDVMLVSPCIGVCTTKEKGGLCEGCYRTKDEIKAWKEGPNTRRIEILKTVMERRQSQD